MERCSAITLASAMLGMHSMRPSSGEVASTLRTGKQTFCAWKGGLVKFAYLFGIVLMHDISWKTIALQIGSYQPYASDIENAGVHHSETPVQPYEFEMYWLPGKPRGCAPVGCEAQVQVLALEQAVHEREDLHDQLVLAQVVAALVDHLVPPAAHCRPRVGQPGCRGFDDKLLRFIAGIGASSTTAKAHSKPTTLVAVPLAGTFPHAPK